MGKEFAMKYSFAYQENKGILEAIMKAQAYAETGNEILVEIDLKD